MPILVFFMRNSGVAAECSRMRVFLMVLLLLSCPVASCVGASETGTDVLFSYDGVDYTCRDVTYVSLGEGLHFAHSSGQNWDPKRHSAPSSYCPPGTCRWLDNGKPDDLAGYYRHQLRGVIELFVREQMLSELKTRFTGDVSRYYDSKRVATYCSAAAKASQDVRDACVTASQTAGTVEAFSTCVRNHCAVNWTDQGLCGLSHFPHTFLGSNRIAG